MQAAPVVLDREATIDRIDTLATDAAADGAELVLFPEAFLPGYPDFVWRSRPWTDNKWYARLADQAVTVPSRATDRLADIARANHIYLVVGIDEREPRVARSTTRCSTSAPTAACWAATAS